MPDDGQLLPFSGAEVPEPRAYIQERMEGLQIAWAHLVGEPGPTGSPMLGLEFTSGDRALFMAGKDKSSRFTARVVIAWMPAPMIVTARMARYFARGRDGQPGQAAPAPGPYADAYHRPDGQPDDLQRALEGAIVRHLRHIPDPAPDGGERLELALSGGATLELAASPTAPAPFAADFRYDLTRPARLWMP